MMDLPSSPCWMQMRLLENLMDEVLAVPLSVPPRAHHCCDSSWIALISVCLAHFSAIKAHTLRGEPLMEQVSTVLTMSPYLPLTRIIVLFRLLLKILICTMGMVTIRLSPCSWHGQQLPSPLQPPVLSMQKQVLTGPRYSERA